MFVMVLLSFLILTAVLWWFFCGKKESFLNPFWMAFCAVISVIIILSSELRSDILAVDNTQITEPLGTLSHKDKIQYLQQKLKQAPNDTDLWFEIGRSYVSQEDYAKASICFDYAFHILEQPTANQYAIKATADYMLNSQQMSVEIQTLLDKALILDEFNHVALRLIASDHFTKYRYQKAINAWQKILASKQTVADKIMIINLINQAKQQILVNS